MNKAYVLKNKKGEYFSYVDNYGFGFDKSIICSHIFVKREGAEREKDFILRNKYKFHIDDLDIVPITICEGDLEEENRVLKKALELACEKLAYVYGECPYSNMNLQMPNYCDEECAKNEKYLCWDKYFIQQAKESN